MQATGACARQPRGRSRRAMRVTFIPLAIFMIVSNVAGQQPAQAPEYQIKAAMMYNFVLFVEWPNSAFASADTPFVFGIMGENPLGTWLNHELNGLRVAKRPIRIVRFQDGVKQATQCHVLFISASLEKGLPEILRAVSSAPVLTISDAANFCAAGGMIGFVPQARNVRFEINAAAVEKANLKVDPKLLRVAAGVVQGKPGE